jgi:aryl-alcohol dehydrogenase-like predicted oxidoreductase
MTRRPLGQTGLEIAPLVLGGNVFGWTADRTASFAVLDAFLDAGLNAIDTADVYSRWADGNRGGESETIIGDWLAARPGARDRIVLITKVGSDMGAGRGLGAAWIARAAEESLRRLRTETIDVYLSHWPDATPHEETLAAYDALIRAGKVRAIGASNYDAPRLRAALDAAAAASLPRYEVLQPEYNLLARDAFEGPLRDLAIAEGIGVITYYSLASGFLTGKYRTEADVDGAARGGAARRYLDAGGLRVVDALVEVAERHSVQPATVALAWVLAKGVTPIASASRPEQLAALVAGPSLRLTADDVAKLDEASQGF